MTYSGIAAEDIDPESITLMVICAELTPTAIAGTVAKGITTSMVSLADRDGKPISSPITTTNHIVATWEGDSNSRYPPLVRKGEPVKVFKDGPEDKYYWCTTGRGRDFRTTDRIHMEVGATDPTKPGVTKDDTNTYSISVDSQNKLVSLKTSKANGEPVAFAIQIDTDSGTFTLSDDTTGTPNRIFLDSGAKTGSPTFQVNLSSGVTLKFDNKDCIISVPGKFLISAKERIVFDSPITIFNLNKVGTIIMNASAIALNSASDTILTVGGVFGVTTAAAKISGVLVAAAARFANVAKGGAGAGYNPVTISDPINGNPNTANNAADTTAAPTYNFP